MGLGFCSREKVRKPPIIFTSASDPNVLLISARFSTLVQSSRTASLMVSFIRSVVGNCAAEDNASERSPEVFVEYGVNDLENSKEESSQMSFE